MLFGSDADSQPVLLHSQPVRIASISLPSAILSPMGPIGTGEAQFESVSFAHSYSQKR